MVSMPFLTTRPTPLNEVLHQGPTLLPELYGMLLRFRIKQYMAISDVEQAFLQISIHEDDRDATRFLLMRDVKLPPQGGNLIYLRFTRFPFGLNASLFLLGGTIGFHLRNSVSDKMWQERFRTSYRWTMLC